MFYLIANFKSNLTLSEYEKYAEILDKGLSAFSIKPGLSIILCPTSLYAYLFTDLVKKYPFVKLGLQNASQFIPGAYTGEINAMQVKDLCDYCVIGHSERRKYFKEDSLQVKEKLQRLIDSGVTPIVCVSKTDELTELIDKIGGILIAYEPLDYIGGKDSAPTELVDNFYASSSLSQIIYGGSVNLDNFETYLPKKYINGFLIGGFCLNPVDFLKLIQKTNNLLSV